MLYYILFTIVFSVAGVLLIGLFDGAMYRKRMDSVMKHLRESVLPSLKDSEILEHQMLTNFWRRGAQDLSPADNEKIIAAIEESIRAELYGI